MTDANHKRLHGQWAAAMIFGLLAAGMLLAEGSAADDASVPTDTALGHTIYTDIHTD
jgi:hypothetical protein